MKSISARSWKKTKWGNLATLEYGKGLCDYKNESSEDVPYQVFGTNGPIGWHSAFLCDVAGIIVGRKGAYRGIHYSSAPFFVIDTAFYLRPKTMFDIRWAYYQLKNFDINRLDSGSAIPSTSREAFYEIPVLLPLVPMQKRIAKILSVYDDLIESNNQRIKILEQMAQTIYDEWFVKFRFPGHSKVKMVDSELGKIPEGWELRTIDDIVDIQGGFAFKSKTFLKHGDYGIVTIKNVQDGKFISKCESYIDEIPEKMPKRCVLSYGDILLSLTGNVGRICLVYGEEYLLNQRVAKLVSQDKRNSAFVYSLYKHPMMRVRLEQISTGVAQQNLSPIQMGKLKIIYPSNGLLAKYAEICNPMIEEMIVLFNKNTILQETRDIFLPKLISGEIDVEDMDIDIGDVDDR